MTRICAVVGCSHKTNKNKDKMFYSFPSVRDNRGRDLQLGIVQRAAWIKAIRRQDLSASKIRYGAVCSDHFISGKPAQVGDLNNPDYVPTQKMGYLTSGQPSATTLQRYQRARKRLALAEDSIEVADLKFDTSKMLKPNVFRSDAEQKEFREFQRIRKTEAQRRRRAAQRLSKPRTIQSYTKTKVEQRLCEEVEELRNNAPTTSTSLILDDSHISTTAITGDYMIGEMKNVLCSNKQKRLKKLAVPSQNLPSESEVSDSVDRREKLSKGILKKADKAAVSMQFDGCLTRQPQQTIDPFSSGNTKWFRSFRPQLVQEQEILWPLLPNSTDKDPLEVEDEIVPLDNAKVETPEDVKFNPFEAFQTDSVINVVPVNKGLIISDIKTEPVSLEGLVGDIKTEPISDEELAGDIKVEPLSVGLHISDIKIETTEVVL